ADRSLHLSDAGVGLLGCGRLIRDTHVNAVVLGVRRNGRARRTHELGELLLDGALADAEQLEGPPTKCAASLKRRLDRFPHWRHLAMPGVPREMTPMWESIEASLQGGGALRWRTLKLLGIGESAVEEKLAELVRSTSPTVATYAKNDGVHVRVADKAATPQEADARVAQMERAIRARLGEYVWGTDEETLPA